MIVLILEVLVILRFFVGTTTAMRKISIGEN